MVPVTDRSVTQSQSPLARRGTHCHRHRGGLGRIYPVNYAISALAMTLDVLTRTSVSWQLGFPIWGNVETKGQYNSIFDDLFNWKRHTKMGL